MHVSASYRCHCTWDLWIVLFWRESATQSRKDMEQNRVSRTKNLAIPICSAFSCRKCNIIVLTTSNHQTTTHTQTFSLSIHWPFVSKPQKKHPLKKPLEPAQSWKSKIHLPPMCIKRPLVLSWNPKKNCVWQSEKSHHPMGWNGMKSVHPRNLTWNLKRNPWKRRFRTWKPSFSGSMLNFGGVSNSNAGGLHPRS